MAGKSGTSYEIAGINGKIAGHVHPGFFKKSLEYKPDESDVILTSYPKCGTTWMQLIVHLLMHDLTPLTRNEQLWMRRKYYLEYYLGKESAEELPKSRLLKTHLTFDLIPYNKRTKYIYVTRNPYDCCVSLHRFITGMKDYGYDLSFERFFYDFVDGTCLWGDYFKHVTSWYGHRNDSNVLFVVYENLKEDPRREIRKIGQFLGGPCMEIVRDERRLDRVIQLSRFDEMSRADGDADNDVLMKTGARFFRKGNVGDYKLHMTDRQLQILKEKYDGYLKGTFLHDLWRQYVP